MNKLFVYWSFRSPFCYLSLQRLIDIANYYQVEIVTKVVWPLAIRKPEFFSNAHKNSLSYHQLDAERVADYYGIPYRRPKPDPISQDMVTGEIQQKQPYIYNLVRTGAFMELNAMGFNFIKLISPLLWDGSINGWNNPDNYDSIVRRLGYQPQQIATEIRDNSKYYDSIINMNQKLLEESGHWGVPTFVFNDEPFFGQDRLDILRWRMAQCKIPRRS